MKGASIMQLFPSGTRIASRYEVAGTPLMGGMGIVYLCFDHGEQRPVALKTFRPEFLPDRGARDRFLQEGETWVRLGKHPHIVRCYQVFQDSPRPEVYLALELIAKEEGRRDASLRSWLTPGRPLPLDQALLIALQIVRGMSHAAEVIPGFVHRDLKPENVLVGADRLSNAVINRVRVTDFGLVKGLRSEQLPAPTADKLTSSPGRLTRAGSVLGTPSYMAPEQWKRPDVDVRADIYTFGCILGEMLVGRMLVQGQTLDELRQAHQGGQALAAARAAPAVLAELLGRCLAVESVQRYADWGAVEAVLAAAYSTATGQMVPGPELVSALSRAERVETGWSYSEIGVSYVVMGKAQAALTYFQYAYQSGQAEGERLLEAAALGGLGMAYGELGDPQQAIEYFEQVLAIGRETGGRRGEGSILSNLGEMYRQLGAAQRAVEYHSQALAIHRELGNRFGEAQDLGNLGNAYIQLGDPRQAIGYYEQALPIRREVGDRRGEGHDLSNLGGAYADLGETLQAVEALELALQIHREIGDRRGESNDLGFLGHVYMRLGDARRAIGYHEQALSIFREIGDRRGEGGTLGNLGNTYQKLGDARRSIKYHQQSLAIRREIGDRRGEGVELANLGLAYLSQNDLQRTMDCCQRAMGISREIGDRRGVAVSSLCVAQTHARQGDLAQALPLFRDAARLFTQMGYVGEVRIVQQFLAEIEPLMPVIDVAVAATRGDRNARNQLEASFPAATQTGLMIADPIRRIWAGERDDAALTAGLDESDSIIVREILRRL
jgi:tetratricopeptide (TPR) repeat protein